MRFVGFTRKTGGHAVGGESGSGGCGLRAAAAPGEDGGECGAGRRSECAGRAAAVAACGGDAAARRCCGGGCATEGVGVRGGDL